jgi:hypothetical protein
MGVSECVVRRRGNRRVRGRPDDRTATLIAMLRPLSIALRDVPPAPRLSLVLARAGTRA